MESLVGSNDTRYIIKFGPSISEGSEDYVHHVIVYTCNGLTDEDLGPGGPCHEKNEKIEECLDRSGIVIAAWAVGGIDFIYPDHVAYPIGVGDGGDHRYFVIELHYNNPEMKSGIIDNSGILFTYLDEPREYDAGMFYFGHQISPTLIIPPSAHNYTVPVFCPSECTEPFLPADGIKIFANMLHTHLAGTGLSVSLLRQNDTDHYEEIRPIDKNLRYDFNFQQVTYLPEEITVFPGDSLLLECTYDTSTRTGTTFGGESTKDEMCVSFPIYYPRTNLLACTSRPLLDKLEEFVSKDVPLEKQQPFSILAVKEQFTPENIDNAITSINWTDQLLEDFKNALYVEGTLFSYCRSEAGQISRYGLLPEISKYYSKPATVRNCTVVETRPDGASPIQVSIMMLLTFTALSLYILLR